VNVGPLQRAWDGFRRLHIGLQIVNWIVLFPFVAALAISRGRREPVWRPALGTLTLVLLLPFWLVAVFFGSSTLSETETAGGVDAPATETNQQDSTSTSDGAAEATDETDTSPDATPPSLELPNLETSPATNGRSTPGSDSPTTSEAQARAPPTESADGVLVSALFAQLTVAQESVGGYDRSLFPHWITTSGCTTRNRVLIRDSNGTAVTTTSCTVTSGQWYSLFDDVWVDAPRSIDIDHFVPLAEAWRSGAHAWDTASRRAFANDLTDPRTLIAVTASSNRSKSDSDPADWLPTNRSYHCDYVGSWVAIKYRWELTIDMREQAAIQRVLDGCGELRTSPPARSSPRT